MDNGMWLKIWAKSGPTATVSHWFEGECSSLAEKSLCGTVPDSKRPMVTVLSAPSTRECKTCKKMLVRRNKALLKYAEKSA